MSRVCIKSDAATPYYARRRASVTPPKQSPEITLALDITDVKLELDVTVDILAAAQRTRHVQEFTSHIIFSICIRVLGSVITRCPHRFKI